MFNLRLVKKQIFFVGKMNFFGTSVPSFSATDNFQKPSGQSTFLNFKNMINFLPSL